MLQNPLAHHLSVENFSEVAESAVWPGLQFGEVLVGSAANMCGMKWLTCDNGWCKSEFLKGSPDKAKRSAEAQNGLP